MSLECGRSRDLLLKIGDTFFKGDGLLCRKKSRGESGTSHLHKVDEEKERQVQRECMIMFIHEQSVVLRGASSEFQVVLRASSKLTPSNHSRV